MATFAYLDIDQGSDFNIEVMIDDDDNPQNFGMDLSGFTAHSQFRKNFGSSTAYAFEAEITDFDKGIVTLTLAGEDSSNILPGRYIFDVEIYNASSGVKLRVLEGIVTISPEVTKVTYTST